MMLARYVVLDVRVSNYSNIKKNYKYYKDNK